MSERLSSTRRTLPANTASVRQLVINKQNARTLASRNALTNQMEDALVKWRPPVSCHAGSTAALRGKHPYQMDSPPGGTELGLRFSLDTLKRCFETFGHSAHSVHSMVARESAADDDASTAMCWSVQEFGTAADIATPYALPVSSSTLNERENSSPMQYSFPIPVQYLPVERNTVDARTQAASHLHERDGCWPSTQAVCIASWNQFVTVVTCSGSSQGVDTEHN
ncbi:LAMI_0E11342g1_1 [Lachancea mirantina]|uniref:LAMI_0E11342g1_1 n=1 Tax=Lachancea mirantina TaxID=1230905 RepID=A0A1G4JPJ1_9SACH|nr:LAMI_0E11342g1_1 [Lachancea mirantina]